MPAPAPAASPNHAASRSAVVAPGEPTVVLDHVTAGYGPRIALADGVLSRLTVVTREAVLGERCGITVPTRFAFKHAGYYPVLKRMGAKAYHFEETPQVEIPLYHPGRLRDALFTPEPVAKADFFVNCPKFKAHPWTTVTFSMKNYIGIQDDRHRLIDHDHRLNEKIADLQHIIQPQFIAIDAITAGEGRMLTPTPFDLGMIIMGNSQVAFDAVCCRIIGIDPNTVDRYGIPVLRFHWKWSDYETKQVKHMQETFRSIVTEMGGEVWSPMPSPDQGYGIAPGGAIIHELGGTRMGADPGSSVVNKNCQTHDVKNLFVADGGPFTSQADKNPTWTIMALSWRTADYVAQQMKGGSL